MHSKITFILEEAYSARINNLKKSIVLGQKALELAKDHGFVDLQAKACSHLSLFNMINGNGIPRKKWTNFHIP